MLNRFNNFILLFTLLINSILLGDLFEKRIRQDFTQNSFETYERTFYRNEQELVNFIESLVQINNIPGASVAVVKDDIIVL